MSPTTTSADLVPASTTVRVEPGRLDLRHPDLSGLAVSRAPVYEHDMTVIRRAPPTEGERPVVEPR